MKSPRWSRTRSRAHGTSRWHISRDARLHPRPSLNCERRRTAARRSLCPVSLQTTAQPDEGKFWGDTVGFFDGEQWTPPQGTINFDDVNAAVKSWQVANGAPAIPRTDVEPQEPNRVTNFNDVLFEIFAFQGDPYPFGCPADPCQDNVANPCP